MLVEIWSDIACPWCYVGKRRFEAALRLFEHRQEVVVHWRSFELDPGAPAERGGDGADHLARKYGTTREQAIEMFDRMTRAGAEDGLDFHFELQRSGSTFDGHRLVHLADAHGLQDAMKERLLKAYLEEGQLVSDHAMLRRTAAEVGLPADAVADLLACDHLSAEVREDERIAAQLGISGVPFFVVDRALAASGAQPPELLRQLLDQAWAKRIAAAAVTAPERDASDPDGR